MRANTVEVDTSERPTRLLLAGAALVALPFVAERFYLQLVTQMMVLAIFALSLDLLVGFTGLVSFGHAAFYGHRNGVATRSCSGRREESGWLKQFCRPKPSPSASPDWPWSRR